MDVTPLSSVILVSVLCIITPRSHAEDDVIQRVTVRTPLGDVTGRVTTVLNATAHQFRGIPYAESPLKELRFKKPVPVSPWTTPLDATQFGPSCPQSAIGISEDCLYLNIFVKASETAVPAPPRPVMIWIHGGGFVAGSGSSDGSLLAVRGDVVVVTINYRLGMLGWLSTLDQASTGNYGLWDQKMAIHFVRDNIAAFGGDPNQITIFGESAGGYSVGLQTISPLNDGLFKRAIMESGSALARRAIALDPTGMAERFAEHLNCLKRTGTGFDTLYLVDCARNKTVDEILRATSKASALKTLAWQLDVAPVVDGEIIPVDVRSLLGQDYHGRVPFWDIDVMVGTTNAEGSLVLGPLFQFQRQLGFDLSHGVPDSVFCTNITTALARDYFQGSKAVSDALCKEYSSQDGDEDQGRQVVNMYGDMMFVSAAVETLELHTNNSQGGRSRYQYLFAHTPTTTSPPCPWFKGAGHGSEVSFVFGRPMLMSDPAEARLSLAMVDGWTNFAKFGSPNDPQSPDTFNWPEYDLAQKSYTNLDLELTSQHDLYSQRMQFWAGMHEPKVGATQTEENKLEGLIG